MIIGIDLGTTHCAVAAVDPGRGAAAPVEDFAIPQLQRPGEVVTQALLPSALYAASEHELPAGAAQLPWGPSPPLIAGEFARWQGARVPGRLVASAKSWLSHAGVDRTAAILPWGAPAEVAKVSPVDASAQLLAHLAAAWNHAHPDRPLAAQELVITVPASFDEVARALTVQAARRAGLENFTLVEEPQAAFYDFIAQHRGGLGAVLAGVRLVLVVDVGGGTSDFTLIEVSGGEDEDPVLRRIAVSDHLLLGGDNMDATLARAAEGRMVAEGRRLAATQWAQLVQVARGAKESLLGGTPPERQAIAIAGEGSRLLGRTLATEVTREEATQLILDGFFPACAPDDEPRRMQRGALQELGLPYAQDPAITRHIAAFLRQHAGAAWAALGGAAAGGEGLPRPDAILLNGGVFKAAQLRARLIDVVSAWWPDAPRLRELPHTSLDLAVARGAAYYGLVRRGLGRRIGGGTAHAVYVGLAAETGARAARAVCLIPRGHEEGVPVDLDQRSFTLQLGRPVQFPLFSTTADRLDRPGDVVAVDETFHPLPPIHTLLKRAGAGSGTVPVHLRATLTPLGTLELWCVANTSDERWRLEFELRGAVARPEATVIESMPERFGEARQLVGLVFGNKPQPVPPKEVRDLVRNVEAAIGPRATWSLPLLRELWGVVFAGANKRRRSPHHERAFFQLLGFCLRPGFGYPLDDWRCEQTFGLFAQGVAAHHEQKVWREFWVTWRRIAGGLTEEQHETIWKYLEPHLARRVPPHPAPNLPKPKGVQPEGLDEMVRAAASLEHLAPAAKVRLGNWIVARLRRGGGAGGPWTWALGRLGARVPLHGAAHKTVDPETVGEWLSALFELGVDRVEGAPFAVAQLARLTGDRTRDLDEDLRARAAAALRAARAPERWIRMVREIVALEAADEARAWGDTLPIGLSLQGG